MVLEGPDPVGGPAGGLEVVETLAGSMAADAGLRAGDRLVAIDGEHLPTLEALHRAARRLAGGTEATLAFLRDGARLEGRAAFRPAPQESMPGCQVLYGEVRSRGKRLRTIVTRPEAPGPHPAVLLLPGISCDSVDYWYGPGQAAPLWQLVRGCARAGFVTMRLDRPGVGDSEGGPCAEVDFMTEVEAFEAGLEALRRLPCVDPGNIFLFGHSVGGMIAPRIASEGLSGIAVFGTTPWRWSRCMLASLRRQMVLRGRPDAELDERAGRLERLYGAMYGEGLTQAQAVAREPALAACGDQRFGRSLAYLQQLDTDEVQHAWSRVQCPVLVLHGEHDWVVSKEEQRAIVDLVGAGGKGSATLTPVEGADHLMGEHSSLSESLERYGEGPFCRRVEAETVRFMHLVAGG